MIEFQRRLTRGIESALEKTSIEDGKLRFVTDTGRLFLDNNSERIEITDFIKGKTEEEIRSVIAPLPKFYFASDTKAILVYDGNDWVKCCDRVSYADTATNASTAVYAKNSGTATYSINSDTAINASTANYASNAGTSSYSTNAGTATNASTATYATNSSTATYSDNAGTASYANKALNDANGKLINTTYAPLASPIFTGIPSAPTPTPGANDTQIANTEFVTKAIIDAIGGITNFKTSVVTELPATGDSGTIYFMSNSDQNSTDDIYEEYIWVNDKFELIGSTRIDLSGYINSVNISGTGNAITGATITNNGIQFTKDASFLTEHPSVSKNSSTATETPNAGSTIEVVDSVTVDNYGHLIDYRKKVVTLPNYVQNASTANYAKNAGTASYGSNAGTATYANNAGTANYAKSIANEADIDFGDLDE